MRFIDKLMISLLAVFVFSVIAMIYSAAYAEYVDVELTAYTPEENHGNYTSSGTVPSEGRTIACNWLPFGTKVMISGNWYTVEDRGGMSGIDIFMDSYHDAVNFGRQTQTVYIQR